LAYSEKQQSIETFPNALLNLNQIHLMPIAQNANANVNPITMPKLRFLGQLHPTPVKFAA
jgi:hypothetical protein